MGYAGDVVPSVFCFYCLVVIRSNFPIPISANCEGADFLVGASDPKAVQGVEGVANVFDVPLRKDSRGR